MNFNNIYWNNTFKSVLQLAFRSVTWKLGNLRGAGSAIGPEMLNSFRDPLEAFRRDWNGNGGGGKGGAATVVGAAAASGRGSMFHPSNARKYVPRVGMNQGWLLGMLFTSAVIGTVAYEVYGTGQMALGAWSRRTARKVTVCPARWRSRRCTRAPGARNELHRQAGAVEPADRPARLRAPVPRPGGLRQKLVGVLGFARLRMARSRTGTSSRTTCTTRTRRSIRSSRKSSRTTRRSRCRSQNLTDHYGPQDTTSKVLRAAGLGNAQAPASTTRRPKQKMRSHEAA
jgi:hypothetical protein